MKKHENCLFTKRNTLYGQKEEKWLEKEILD